ncbi:MAG: hypothetical protein LBN31_02655, partial [Hungatella sp.]|nr:hypothetical protein [Hungatella sp.]
MNERIKRLAEDALVRDVYPAITPVSYTNESMFLPECQTIAVRLGEYLRGQTAVISDDEMLIGKMHFDDSVTSEYYAGRGHKHFHELNDAYYLKPVDKLCYVEWIHSGADLEFIINNGFEGYYKAIDESKKQHEGNKEKLEFLEALRLTADALLSWTDKCADACMKNSEAVSTLDRRHELLELSRICRRVPRKPPTSFYEAVQTAYFVFMFLPDSPGRIDQYLYPLYQKDITSGHITRDFARELIQEYLVMVFAHQGFKNHRSGDNHFCIGGYTQEGKDGFNELSELILKAYTELPIWRPQISFRWTKLTTPETMEKITRINKQNMNVVFVSDEPRIKAYMNLGIPYEDAVNYTTVGCNETQIQGKGVFNSGVNSNIGRSIALMLAEHRDICLKAEDFENFRQAYLPFLHKDLDDTIDWNNKFYAKRAKDISMIGSLLNDGCIESGKSITAGGAKYHFGGSVLNGIVCVGDSLSIIKQFVYEEKRVSMETLLNALANNWNGYEDLHEEIMRDGRFYGNDDDQPDLILKQIVDEIYDHTKDRLTDFGGHFMFGEIVGYNPSNVYFASLLPATPDGRYDGEAFCIGMSQLDNKDHVSLSALMRSVAKIDYAKFGGPIVVNLKIDKRMADDDEKLKKLAALYHTYFQLGGMQFQPNYISTDELLKAQRQPEQYKNLRVRVSGFSGNFTLLGKDIQ